MIHNITFCLLRMGNSVQQCWWKMLRHLAFQERQIYLSHKQFYSMSNFTDPLLRLCRKLRMWHYEMSWIFVFWEQYLVFWTDIAIVQIFCTKRKIYFKVLNALFILFKNIQDVQCCQIDNNKSWVAERWVLDLKLFLQLQKFVISTGLFHLEE